MNESADQVPARPGGAFFADPDDPTQRRYEALRAYLYEGVTADVVGVRFGYTPATVRTMVRDFRAGRRDFFTEAKPGPKRARPRRRPGPGWSSCARPGGSRSTRSPRC